MLVTVWKTVGYPLVIYLAGHSRGPPRGGGALGANSAFATYLAPPHPDEPVPPDHAHRHELSGFDIVRIMTQGGPVTATMIYVYYIYEQAFQY